MYFFNAQVIRSNDVMYKAGQTEMVILRKLSGADPAGKRHCVRMLRSFEYRQHLCLVFESMVCAGPSINPCQDLAAWRAVLIATHCILAQAFLGGHLGAGCNSHACSGHPIPCPSFKIRLCSMHNSEV